MRNKQRNAQIGQTSRLNRRATVVPEVPTVAHDPQQSSDSPSPPHNDPIEDAVRRMVEAAYT